MGSLQVNEFMHATYFVDLSGFGFPLLLSFFLRD